MAFWRRVRHHLFVRAYPFLIAVGGIALVAAAAVAIGRAPVEEATIAGAGMELLGLAMVVVGLKKLREDFRRPSLFASVRAWFRDLPTVFKKQHPRIITGIGGLSASVSIGSVGLIIGPGPGSPIERRVELLEKAVQQLRDEHRRELDKHDRELARLTGDLAQEKDERTRGDDKLRSTVEDVAVGGLHLEFVGVTWLFLGIFLGTLPEQSVAIIRWALCLIR